MDISCYAGIAARSRWLRMNVTRIEERPPGKPGICHGAQIQP
jgi:hypothetical protein